MFSITAIAKDIENFFPGCNGADLSGSYQFQEAETCAISGQSGKVELTKWKSVTTARGKELQFYKILVQQGEYQGSGISIFDGSRLYTGRCSDTEDRDNYYIVLLGELRLPEQEQKKLAEAWQATPVESSHPEIRAKWKGKTPWYGFHDTTAQSFGYYFWADGTWGTFSTSKTGWSVTGDSGLFSLRELKRNGEHELSASGFTSIGGFVPSYRESNLVIDILFDSNPKNNYWGFGFHIPVTESGSDSLLVAMMGGPEDSYTSVHEISGKSIRGKWAFVGSLDQTSEVWTVPEEVLARNPKLFK